MGRPNGTFETDAPARGAARRSFELFVTRGFTEMELSSITHTLIAANLMLAEDRFSWRFVSDTPGLVTGVSGMLVRAEPAIMDHGYSDVMIVVGGRMGEKPAWLPRARAMQRQGRGVVLLSDAATAYIKATTAPKGYVTTHWRDLAALEETGYYPNLTAHFSEVSNGIITAAGAAATAELVIGLIAPQLKSPQVAELGNRLLLQSIRKSDAEQPKDIADNEGLFDHRVTQAIRLMEETVAEPLSMAELCRQVGLSSRQLERVFRQVFNDSPAKFYKRVRAKRARAMIEQTLMPMVEIAVATGFGSVSTLSKVVKDEYGMTPSKMRSRRKIKLLAFDAETDQRAR